MTVEELLIKIKADTKDIKTQTNEAKNSLKEISAQADKTSTVFRKLRGTTDNVFRRITSGPMTKEYKKVQNAISETSRKLDEFRRKQASLSSVSVQTDAFASVQKEIAGLEKEIDKLEAKRSKMNIYSQPFAETSKKINELRFELDKYLKKAEELEDSGAAYKHSKEYDSLGQKIKDTEAKLGGLINKSKDLEKSGKDRRGGLFERVKQFGVNANRSFSQAGRSAMMSFGQILRYAVGIHALYSAFSKMRSYFSEGFGNLAQYSKQASMDLARLKGSLTQVKNSLAVAFAPIVTVIAPYIQTLVNLITTACNALAMFFGALTGQKTVSLAKASFGDIAAGATGAADATGAANGAAEEYQRTLMGFDQINKLEDSSGSGGGGGAGGVGGAAGFSTGEVTNVASGWADKVKEAWAKADFTEIGATIARKINDAMDKIKWDSIKEKCNKVATSIGTFINGFVRDFNWGTLGNTISQGFITAYNTVSTFLETVDWQQIGRKIVEFIKGIDWAGLFSSIAEFAGAKLGAIAGVLWGILTSAASGIKEYFSKKIEEAGGDIVLGIFTGIKDGLKSIGSWIIKNIWQPFWKGFKAAFGISSPAKKMKPLGKNIVDGLLEGLKNAWKNITKFFSDGVKSLGKFFKDPVGSIKVAIDKGVNKAKDLYDSFKNKTTTTSLVGSLKDSIKTAWSWFSSFKDKTTMTTVKGDTTQSIKNAWDWYKSFVNDSATVTVYGDANSLKNSVANAVSDGIKVGGGLTIWGKAGGGILANGSWKPVTMAAGGGAFGMGQMFVAREAGPELVGTIGGHTAVMNNDQIVSSVAAGVAQAVAAVMGNNDMDVKVVLEGDADKLFRVVRKEAYNYTNTTGLAPFPV